MEKTNLKVKCCELSDFERKFQGKDLFLILNVTTWYLRKHIFMMGITLSKVLIFIKAPGVVFRES